MIALLAKFFVKPNMDEMAKRKVYGMLCGSVGIFLNLILFAGKLIAGLLSGSIAIMADAFNNLSDAGSSIVTLLGFKIASQKPDAEHPYGHGRVEYVAGFIVSALILAMAVTLLKDSIQKIIQPEALTFSWILIAILAVSILVKAVMAFYNFYYGKKVSSVTIKAAGTDSISDCLATSVVLGATLLYHYTGVQADAYCGALVGLMIGYAGYSAAKDTLNPLLGQPPEHEFVEKIEELTMNYSPLIMGMHDLLVHDYGPGRRFISLHAEVPAEGNILEIHEMIDGLERELQKEVGCFATVHMDPIVTSDPRVKELKRRTRKALDEVSPEIAMHDFRVVLGEQQTNLMFDVLVPVDFKASDEDIRNEILEKIKYYMGKEFHCVIDIDRDYNGIMNHIHEAKHEKQEGSKD